MGPRKLYRLQVIRIMQTMISLKVRKKQLITLANALRDLVLVLEKDSECQWAEHFKSSLFRSEQLLEKGFTQAELNDLSVSVNSVYQGMGSFSDYAPYNYNSESKSLSAIPGTEDFDSFAGKVYDFSLELRVVGRY
jgi:hypothetical protein